jgi:hypothetical protein
MGMCQKTSDANASPDVWLCAQVCTYNLQVRQAPSRDDEIAAGGGRCSYAGANARDSYLRPKRGKSIFAAQLRVPAPHRESTSVSFRARKSR